MKKSSTLLIFLLMGLTAAFAQETPRTWQQGPLSWDDFTAVAPRDDAAAEGPVEHSFLEFVFDIKTVAHKQNGIQTGQAEAQAFTLKSKSWVDSCHRTPAELRYNQVLWDMVELYRRQLQQWINAEEPLNEELLLDSIMQVAIDNTDTYCSVTNFGQDSDAVLVWQRRIADALDRTAADATLDSAKVRAQYTYSDDPLRLGGSLGAGFMGTCGGLHDYFSNGGLFNIGFEIGHNRHFLMVSGSVGGATCRRDAPNTQDHINDLFEGDPITILDGWFGYGFSVVDCTRLRVTPFVGWGGLGFYYTEDNGDEDATNSFGTGDGCWHFGVDVQWHFHNSIFSNEHERYSVDLKLFGTSNRFRRIEGTPQGFTINALLGISMLSGTATRSRVEY